MSSVPESSLCACELTDGQRRERSKSWRAVAANRPVERVAIPGGVRLTFPADVDVARDLVELVAAERACCAWASWTLVSTAHATVVEATADGDGADVLRSLFSVDHIRSLTAGRDTRPADVRSLGHTPS